MNKSPYAKQLADDTFEYGTVLQQPGERDIMFPQGKTPDYDSAIATATAITPILRDYFVTASYATPSGAFGNWSGTVLALHSADAHKVATALVHKRRKVAGKLDIKVNETGELRPLVSLPDLSRILHNAGVQAGNGVAFSKIAADILSYTVATPPTYERDGAASYSRDAGMMVDLQNVIRAALRELSDTRIRNTL